MSSPDSFSSHALLGELSPTLRESFDSLTLKLAPLKEKLNVYQAWVDAGEQGTPPARPTLQEYDQILKITAALKDMLIKKRLPVVLEGEEDLETESYVFTIKDAVNPHKEALLEAGLDPTSPETQETREVIINLKEVLARQAGIYNDLHLPEWSEALSSQYLEYYLNHLTQEDKDFITQQLKTGHIPLFMPGRDTLTQTFTESLTKLTPVWYEHGTERKDQKAPSVWDEGFTTPEQIQVFTRDIPDHPHLLFTKPTQSPPQDTKNKSFQDQQTLLKTLTQKDPTLHGLDPMTYGAMQAVFTREIEHITKQSLNQDPQTLKPIDHDTFTRFPLAGAVSGLAPRAAFGSVGRQVLWGRGVLGAIGWGGFRLLVRRDN